MATSVKKTLHCIGLPKESWLYLRERQRVERCGTDRLKELRQKWEAEFTKKLENGFRRVCDGDFGGCIGPIENGWEQGRWTSWTCENMKKMLDEQGLPWVQMDNTEEIAISL